MREDCSVEQHELAVVLRPFERIARRLKDVRPEPLELVEKRLRVQCEDAAVPVVVAAGHVAFRRLEIWFLEEAIYLERTARTPFQGKPLADVTVLGAGFGSFDAEQHEAPLCSHAGRSTHRFDKFAVAADSVVGRRGDEHAVAIVLGNRQGGDSHRRRRVARDRLEKDLLRLDAGADKFLAHEKAMVAVAEDDRGRKSVTVREPCQRCGKECRTLLVEKGYELLWMLRARERPKPRPGAAGENDWVD